MTKVSIAIIGSGVVGSALAYELSKSIDEIVLIESNPRVRSENQSSRNSGVVHAGIYYDKIESPLKAALCVEGNKLLYEFCERCHVPIRKTGKLLVAANPREEEYLEEVVRIAAENNVPAVRAISMDEARRFEPNLCGSRALYVPTSGIIDPTSLVSKLRALAVELGTIFLPGNKVVEIVPKKSSFEVVTMIAGQRETAFESAMVINAAGLYSDEIARMIDHAFPYEIDPVRGESAKFYNSKRPELLMKGMNVYPAPYVYFNHTGERALVSLKESKELCRKGLATKTVGIHLTPTFDEGEVIGNTVTIGPAKTIGKGKQDYGSDLRSPNYYHERVASFFPGLRLEDIELHQTGIMAVLKGYHDWIIQADKKNPNFVNLVGIDSPGLTACLAIAKYVRQEIFGLK